MRTKLNRSHALVLEAIVHSNLWIVSLSEHFFVFSKSENHSTEIDYGG